METDSWMKKYIFPGGVIPSLREIVSSMGNDDFHILDIENLRRHYEKTLLCWADNFHNHLDKISGMFDEKIYSHVGFIFKCLCSKFPCRWHRFTSNLVTKGVNNELPLTRWY